MQRINDYYEYNITNLLTTLISLCLFSIGVSGVGMRYTTLPNGLAYTLFCFNNDTTIDDALLL